MQKQSKILISQRTPEYEAKKERINAAQEVFQNLWTEYTKQKFYIPETSLKDLVLNSGNIIEAYQRKHLEKNIPKLPGLKMNLSEAMKMYSAPVAFEFSSLILEAANHVDELRFLEVVKGKIIHSVEAMQSLDEQFSTYAASPKEIALHKKYFSLMAAFQDLDTFLTDNSTEKVITRVPTFQIQRYFVNNDSVLSVNPVHFESLMRKLQ